MKRREELELKKEDIKYSLKEYELSSLDREDLEQELLEIEMELEKEEDLEYLKEQEGKKKPIRYCSVHLKMRDGELYWVDNFMDAELDELKDLIEEFLLANPEINKEEISQIILTL